MQQFSVGNDIGMIYKSAFSVVDLGVMTPCEKIIHTAIKENAGIKYIFK